MIWLILVIVVLVLLTVINISVLMADKNDSGDQQRLRETKYWNAIDRIIETDDWTHGELVRYITEEMYSTSKLILATLLSDCHNAADVPSLEKLLTERTAQLDVNYNTYVKKQNKEARNENTR